MAKRNLKYKAIKLRLSGKSYSEIKQKIFVSKSTLSRWLEPFPLSPQQLRKLRDLNPRRIENFKRTMAQKRAKRFEKAYQQIKLDLENKKWDSHTYLIAGLFLYWGEGSKTSKSSVSLSNTDPAMLKFFLSWLRILKVPQKAIKINLHLYADMHEDREIDYWSKTLGLSRSVFRRPYIKPSKTSDITYRTGFKHGTCNVVVSNQILRNYILMGIRYLQERAK